MSKKIKLKDVETGEIFYVDEIVDHPMSLSSMIRQGMIEGISTTDIKKMTKEEQRLYSELGGDIEDDNTKTEDL